MAASTEFAGLVEEFNKLISPPMETPYAVAAVKVLSDLVRTSDATTVMELQLQLKQAIEVLTKQVSEISVRSGCEIFMVNLSRPSHDRSDFASWKQRMIMMGEAFANSTRSFRDRIAQHTERFFRDGLTVLTHSYSRVVMNCLLHASRHYHLNIIVCEARPASGTDITPGMRTARELAEHGIPVTVVPDVGVGAIISQVDMILVGAAAVVESGGVVNRLGTFQLAVVAKEFKKPFYCAAESYKFTRLYPLTQSDLEMQTQIAQLPVPNELARADGLIKYAAPILDYTPPAYITLLFTDLGILTPSAVSDELIKLYHE
ncbi:putative Translation initiation factor eIF-2B subunit alpha [Paratrimastix pyriformis]|uniref:Translation initiation factor eIF2B subunit alpha n=1 Tax=Paratrimastix pyriformis TaxID=342808 RepID=A0ABQ8USM2_9EUKA|nr:putative Translation initiation factor eIF-2B subunit alpha [Paratrimastix pyriformis]